MEMTGHICREYYRQQTQGTLKVYDEDSDEPVFECKTLELPDRDNQQQISCIPEGTYDVLPRYSEKYKNHLHVTDVPNRSLILIHWGNYAGSINPMTGHSDIKGCILVGKSFADIDGDGIKDITSSKSTFNTLMKICPDGLILTIEQ